METTQLEQELEIYKQLLEDNEKKHLADMATQKAKYEKKIADIRFLEKFLRKLFVRFAVATGIAVVVLVIIWLSTREYTHILSTRETMSEQKWVIAHNGNAQSPDGRQWQISGDDCRECPKRSLIPGDSIRVLVYTTYVTKRLGSQTWESIEDVTHTAQIPHQVQLFIN